MENDKRKKSKTINFKTQTLNISDILNENLKKFFKGI